MSDWSPILGLPLWVWLFVMPALFAAVSRWLGIAPPAEASSAPAGGQERADPAGNTKTAAASGFKEAAAGGSEEG